MTAEEGATDRLLPNQDLVAMAERFAAMPADCAEGLIEAYAVAAVAQWRIADATFWQRVKFRSRLLRAVARGSQGDRNREQS